MEKEKTTPLKSRLNNFVRRPFVVFWGYKYYAAPGWQNYIGDAETLEEAINIGKEKCSNEYEWWQVVDLMKKEIVAGEGSSHTGLYGEFAANPGA